MKLLVLCLLLVCATAVCGLRLAKPCIKVYCVRNPCQGRSCHGYPDAVCRANYCNGCNAEWYREGVKVTCGRRRLGPWW